MPELTAYVFTVSLSSTIVVEPYNPEISEFEDYDEWKSKGNKLGTYATKPTQVHYCSPCVETLMDFRAVCDADNPEKFIFDTWVAIATAISNKVSVLLGLNGLVVEELSKLSPQSNTAPLESRTTE